MPDVATPPVKLFDYASAGTSGVSTTGPRPVAAPVPAGAVVVVAAAASGQPITLGVSDSKGNTYQLVRSHNGTTSPASTGALFVCVVATPLTTADTITVTRSGTGSILAAADAFTDVDPTNPVADADAAASTTGTSTTANTPPLDIGEGDLLVWMVAHSATTSLVAPFGTVSHSVNATTTSFLRRMSMVWWGPVITPDLAGTTMGDTDFSAGTHWTMVALTLNRKPNLPPIISAGDDQSVTSGDTVTLTGAATDPDGAIDRTSWLQLTGPPVELAPGDVDQLVVTFTAPPVLEPTELTFRLTVRDNEWADGGGTTTDTVTVTVNPLTVAHRYRVELVLGEYAYTINQGDRPDPDTDPVLVLDGLTMSWSYAGEAFPSPLEPLQATVQLSTTDVRELDNLVLGDVAVVRCIDSEGTVFASLYGDVNELTADQVLRRSKAHPDGALWTVHTVKLADNTVSRNVPIDGAFAGVYDYFPDRITYEYQPLVPWPVRVPAQDMSPQVPLADLTVEEAGAVELLRGWSWQMLAPTNIHDDPTEWDPHFGHPSWSNGESIPPGAFYQLAPITDPDGTFRLMSLHALWFDTPATDLPAKLAIDAGELRLVPVTGSPNVVPGERVRLEGQWRKGPENNAAAITVKGRERAATSYRPGLTDAEKQTAVRREINMDAYEGFGKASFRDIGDLIFAQWEESQGWARDSFTYAPADPTDLSNAWWPNWTTEHYSAEPRPQGWRGGTSPDDGGVWWNRGGVPVEAAAPCFTRPVVIFGIPDAGNLSGQAGVYAGLLTAVALTVQGGAVSVTFSMRRAIARPYADTAALTYGQLRTMPDVAYRDATPRVDPRLTLLDLRLVRG